MRKLLLVAIAVVLIAGVVWFLLFVGGDGQVDGFEQEEALSRVGEPISKDERAGGGEVAKRSSPGRGDVAGGRSVRRFESRSQRERVLALIAAAARARREAISQGEEDRDAGADGDGALTRESIKEGVQTVIEDIKLCYDSVLKTDPDLEGKLVVNFEIVGEPDAGGVVDDVKIADSSDEVMRDHEGLTECMLDAIYSIELPPPKSGGRVKVSYPFTMRPD